MNSPDDQPDYRSNILEPVDDESLSNTEQYLEEDAVQESIPIADGGKSLNEEVEEIYEASARNRLVLSGLFGLGALSLYSSDDPVAGTLLLGAAAYSAKKAHDSWQESKDVSRADRDDLNKYSNLRNQRLALAGVSGAAGVLSDNPIFFVPAAYYGIMAYEAQKDLNQSQEESYPSEVNI